MLVSDLIVEVRDSSLARVGQILASDLVGLSLALRFNKVGSWKVQLRSDHPLVDTLRAPGAGLIVTGPNGVLISGPTVQATQHKTAEDPTGHWEIVGTDDSVLLGERIAYPTPTSADLEEQTSAYDVRSGSAETIAKAYVNANMGAGAPAVRQVSGLTIGTDLGRGSTLLVNARFDKLGELLYGILTPSNLGFDILQNGSGLVFDVFQPQDRSAYIRMDVDNLRLAKSEYTYTSPGATRVIVAGQGEGSARTLIERSSTASTAAETSWGRRIEVFKDARNTNDTTELNKAGDEILSTQGFTVEGIKVTPSDDLSSMRFGTEWGLGDKVTVVAGNIEVAKVVTEVGIIVTNDGVNIGATVGDPDTADNETTSSMISASNSQEARISNLERNSATVLKWNDVDGTYEFGLKGGNVTLQIGQEQVARVKNATGSTLTNGTVVYPTGSDGSNKTVAKSLANAEATSSTTFGVLTEDIGNGQKGFATTFGMVHDLNTSALTEGAAVWLSPTVAGGMTSTKPSAPNHMVLIGFCIRSHATNGVLFVKIQNGFELEELHNVAITSPVTGQVIRYNGTNWANAFPAGSVLQVVSATRNTWFSTTSMTYVDVTGVSVSITPKSATSKFLVRVTGFAGCTSANNAPFFQMVRNSTAIGVNSASGASGVPYNNNSIAGTGIAYEYLDSPATTSATTYKLQMRGDNAAVTSFVGAYAGNTSAGVTSITTITVMEIAA